MICGHESAEFVNMCGFGASVLVNSHDRHISATRLDAESQ